MARWVVVREGRGLDGVRVFYDNLLTGVRYPLGTCPGDVDDDLVLDWILKHGKPAYGDRIVLSDGVSFYHQPPAPTKN